MTGRLRWGASRLTWRLDTLWRPQFRLPQPAARQVLPQSQLTAHVPTRARNCGGSGGGGGSGSGGMHSVGGANQELYPSTSTDMYLFISANLDLLTIYNLQSTNYWTGTNQCLLYSVICITIPPITNNH